MPVGDNYNQALPLASDGTDAAACLPSQPCRSCHLYYSRQDPPRRRRHPAAAVPPPTGCGCPYSWAPGCRLCDWGDSWVQQAHTSMLPKPGAPVRLSPIRPLKVAFCIPHHNVTGGLKMLLEQVGGRTEEAIAVPAVSVCCSGRQTELPACLCMAVGMPAPRPSVPPLLTRLAQPETPPTPTAADAAVEAAGPPCRGAHTLRHSAHSSAAMERCAGAARCRRPALGPMLLRHSSVPCPSPTRIAVHKCTNTCCTPVPPPRSAPVAFPTPLGPTPPNPDPPHRRTRAWCAARTSGSGTCTMWTPAM